MIWGDWGHLLASSDSRTGLSSDDLLKIIHQSCNLLIWITTMTCLLADCGVFVGVEPQHHDGTELKTCALDYGQATTATRFPEFWISGFLGFWISRFLDF